LYKLRHLQNDFFSLCTFTYLFLKRKKKKMSKLNKDVLSMIFGELLDDNNSLYSLILVNRMWCEVAVPILWNDPWKNLQNLGEIMYFGVVFKKFFLKVTY